MCVIFFSLHRFVVNGCNLPGFWDEIRCFYFQEFLKISEKNRQNISKILNMLLYLTELEQIVRVSNISIMPQKTIILIFLQIG